MCPQCLTPVNKFCPTARHVRPSDLPHAIKGLASYSGSGRCDAPGLVALSSMAGNLFASLGAKMKLSA